MWNSVQIFFSTAMLWCDVLVQQKTLGIVFFSLDESFDLLPFFSTPHQKKERQQVLVRLY